VKHVFLCGATAPQIRAAVENCDAFHGQVALTDCGKFENAVLAAAGAAKEGDIVLMSPASASFDEFKNFMVRGQCFKTIIKEL
jgi:UDP-N-acetylmuramoylalanine--D-glutamate ligase